MTLLEAAKQAQAEQRRLRATVPAGDDRRWPFPVEGWLWVLPLLNPVRVEHDMRPGVIRVSCDYAAKLAVELAEAPTPQEGTP